jgi:hypothetical protein
LKIGSIEGLFQEVQYFTNEKELPQKSVLLLGNVPSHSGAMSSDNGLITIKYSPPLHITAMGQGIL